MIELPSGHVITETVRKMLRISPEDRLSMNVVADNIISEVISKQNSQRQFKYLTSYLLT